MIFVKWMTEKSNFAYNEGGIPISANDDKLPDLYANFKDVELIADEPAKSGEEDLFNATSTLIPSSTSRTAATPAFRASSSTLPTRTRPMTNSSRNGTRSGTTLSTPRVLTPSELDAQSVIAFNHH